MKIAKLITYNILALIASLNIAYLYFSGGLPAFSVTKDFFYSIAKPLPQIVFLYISTLLVNLSYIAVYAKAKKNLLRVSLIIISTLTLVSIIIRILEYMNGIFWIAGNISTFIQIILLILNILILKDLHKLIRKLFDREISDNY